MGTTPVGTNGLTTISGTSLVQLVADYQASQLATDAAISQAKSQATNGDTSTLNAAKTYTDGEVQADRGRLSAIESKNTAQDAAIGQTLTDAKTYADERDVAYRDVDRALWRAEDDSHEASAKSYTDTEVGKDRARLTPLEATASKVSADTAYARATLDATGKLAWGIKDDGTVHVPRAQIDELNGAEVVTTKIVIVAGQSNSIWRFNTDGPFLAEPDPRLKWWNRISGTMVDVSSKVTPSIASSFARTYLEENDGVELLIVPVTVGSTGFKTSSINPPPAGYLLSSGGTWDRTLTADPNNLALRLFDSLAGALSATGDAEIVAMLWSQGESDRTRMTEATYGAAADDLFTELRSQTGQTFPIILGSFTPEEIANPQFAGTEGILRALEGAQARLFNTAYVWGPENHLEHTEQIHWSPEGNRVRGAVMATDGLRRARLNVSGGKPYSPRNVTVRRSGGTAFIRWDYPPGRVTSFTLETSTNSGSSWAAVPLNGPLVISHTMAVDAALPLWVRLKSTNETGTSYPTMEVKA